MQVVLAAQCQRAQAAVEAHIGLPAEQAAVFRLARVVLDARFQGKHGGNVFAQRFTALHAQARARSDAARDLGAGATGGTAPFGHDARVEHAVHGNVTGCGAARAIGGLGRRAQREWPHPYHSKRKIRGLHDKYLGNVNETAGY